MNGALDYFLARPRRLLVLLVPQNKCWLRWILIKHTAKKVCGQTHVQDTCSIRKAYVQHTCSTCEEHVVVYLLFFRFSIQVHKKKM